jgi:hypothetical protein
MSNTVQALDAKDRSTGTSSISASDRRTVIAFKAGAAIAAKDAVCFDTSKVGANRIVTVVKADSAQATTAQCIGFTLDAATAAGDIVRVVVKGYCEGANVADAVGTAGLLLNAGGVLGRAVAYAAANEQAPFAQALEVASSNTADVWVLGLFA